MKCCLYTTLFTSSLFTCQITLLRLFSSGSNVLSKSAYRSFHKPACHYCSLLFRELGDSDRMARVNSGRGHSFLDNVFLRLVSAAVDVCINFHEFRVHRGSSWIIEASRKTTASCYGIHFRFNISRAAGLFASFHHEEAR